LLATARKRGRARGINVDLHAGHGWEEKQRLFSVMDIIIAGE